MTLSRNEMCPVWGTERAIVSGKYWVREWYEEKTLPLPSGTCGEMELGTEFLILLFWHKPSENFKFIISTEQKYQLFKQN